MHVIDPSIDQSFGKLQLGKLISPKSSVLVDNILNYQKPELPINALDAHKSELSSKPHPSKMENSLKVVGYWVSPYAHRVRWALELKGVVNYEYIEEDLFNRTPLLSQINPVHGKVPVLIHNGNPLPESAIILEYIDQVWPHQPLLPQDPYERAQARFWANFIDRKVAGSIIIALFSEDEDLERALKLTKEYLDKIEEMMVVGEKFFGGETLGYMDLIMGFVAYMIPIWEEVVSVKILDPSRCPGIAAWSQNFLDHPVIKNSEYLPSKDRASTFYRERRKAMLPLPSELVKKLWTDLMR